MKAAFLVAALVLAASRPAAAGFFSAFEKQPDVATDARAQPDQAGGKDASSQPSQAQVFCRALAQQPPKMRELAAPAQFDTQTSEDAQNQSRLDLQSNIQDLQRYLGMAIGCRSALSGPADADALAQLNASIDKEKTELLKQKHLEQAYPPRVRT